MVSKLFLKLAIVSGVFTSMFQPEAATQVSRLLSTQLDSRILCDRASESAPVPTPRRNCFSKLAKRRKWDEVEAQMRRIKKIAAMCAEAWFREIA